MVMTKWDQDIHRIQEIHQLLENRQRYFHLETTHKLGSTGSSASYPKLRSTKRNTGSTEPSVGHSLEANFGSTDNPSVPGSGNNDSSLLTLASAIEEKHDKNGALSDSSDGNCADHSHNESSDSSRSVSRDVNVTKRKKKKSAKMLRKWVAKNVEMASASPSVQRKSNASTVADNIGPRKYSILRFKSISIDNESKNNATVIDKTDKKSVLGPSPSPTLYPKKKKTPNPVKLLRRRSWILKAEMASRLNEDASTMNFNNVITGLSRSSISHAREKLKKAEKSLRATVKNEQRIPSLKKKGRKARDASVNKATATVPKPKSVNRPALSRLLLRQKEDALKSDLNLREAFALIKIDPDPLLKLASTEDNSNRIPQERKSVWGIKKEATKTLPKSDHKDKEGVGVTVDDTRATLSLQRLTKLSIQHFQMQQSLIPSTVQPYHMQKGKKELEKQLKNFLDKSVKPQGKGDTSFSGSFEPSRRKGSISIANTVNQQKTNVNFKKKSQDRRTSIAPPFRLEKTTGKQEALLEGEHSALYSLDRLAGTII